MNIRDLQYLVAVHDLENFSQAAEQCFVSQPTLSGQIKKLEQELGMSLIERSTRNVLFTEFGEAVVVKAREVLLTVSHIKELAEEMKDPFKGDYHLGLIPTVGPFLLPLIMAELNQTFPKINFFLYELKTDQLLEKLTKGELDAAILAKLDWNLPLTELHLTNEAMQLAVHDKSELANQNQAVDQSVLENQTVLMLEDGHCLRDQALGVCFSAGAEEDARFQATSMDTLLHMVATGAGITLIPELACRETKGIKFIPFKDPKPQREIVMVTRKSTARIDVLKEMAETISNKINNCI